MKKNHKKGPRFCPKVHKDLQDQVQEVEKEAVTPVAPVVHVTKEQEKITETVKNDEVKVQEVEKSQPVASIHDAAQKKEQKKQKE